MLIIAPKRFGVHLHHLQEIPYICKFLKHIKRSQTLAGYTL